MQFVHEDLFRDLAVLRHEELVRRERASGLAAAAGKARRAERAALRASRRAERAARRVRRFALAIVE